MLSMRFSRCFLLSLCSLLLLAGAPAWAISIAPGAVTLGAADVGQSFSVSWSLDPGIGYDLTARADLTLESWSDSSIRLGVSIAHTSQPGNTQASLASFGFGTSSDVAPSLAVAGAIFDEVGTGRGPARNYPGGFSGIDVCVYAQQCSGGGIPRILAAGDSDTLVIDLAGDFSGGPLALSNFVTKFQTAFGSYAARGGPGRAIPEPEAALAFAVGAAVVGMAVRHRRRAA